MGNHLVGVAPSQIYPVEHYFTGSFENDLRYESRYKILKKTAIAMQCWFNIQYICGYFGFETNLICFLCSMGSTRFFKVARARIDEGLMVVKVFVKHDPTLPLDKHCANIDDIKKGLANAVNCLPFQRIVRQWDVNRYRFFSLFDFFLFSRWPKKLDYWCVSMLSIAYMIEFLHGPFLQHWRRSGSHSKCYVL